MHPIPLKAIQTYYQYNEKTLPKQGFLNIKMGVT